MKSAQASSPCTSPECTVSCDCQRLCCPEPHQTRHHPGVKASSGPHHGDGEEHGSGGADHSKSLSRMALILTLVKGWQLVPGGKEKSLASGFGGELGAGPRAFLLPS